MIMHTHNLTHTNDKNTVLLNISFNITSISITIAQNILRYFYLPWHGISLKSSSSIRVL